MGKHQLYKLSLSVLFVLVAFFEAQAQNTTDFLFDGSNLNLNKNDKRNTVIIKTSIGKESYSLKSASGGLNVNLNSLSNIEYGVAWRRLLDNGNSYLYGFDVNNSNTTSPTGYTPSIFRQKTQQYFWEKNTFSFDDYKGFLKKVYLGFGMEWRERWADITYPSLTMNSSTRVGFRFALGYDNKWNDQFSYEIKGGLFIPFMFREYQATSGSYSWNMAPTIELKGIYKVSDLIDFSLGFKYAVDQIFFYGAGGRGTLSPRETWQILSIPIELRFKF